jgi:hypothetical protein
MAFRRRGLAGVFTPDFLENYARTAIRRARRRKAARLAWRGTRTLFARGFARRRPLAPLYISTVLFVVAWVLSNTPQGARTAFVLALLGVGPVYWRGRRKKWERNEWLYACAAYAAGSLWAILAAAIGVGPPMPGLILAGMLAAAGPWWWHHRIRPYEPEPASPVEIWQDKLAKPGGAFPGSALRDFRYLAEETA